MRFFLNNNFLLILFFILIIFLYSGFYFLVYIFLIPLFLYLLNLKNKKINYFLLFLGLLIFSLIFSYYFRGYGVKFLFITLIINFLFYFIFVVFSRKLISNRYFFILIPSFFYILFYLFKFTIFNNFWINYSAFLLNKTFLISIYGSFILTFFIVMFNLIFAYIIYSFIIFFNRKKFDCNNFKLLFLEKIYYFLIFILFILIFLIPSNFLSSNYNENYLKNETNNIEILGVQPNLEHGWVERILNFEDNFNMMINLTEEGLNRYNKTKIVVWPEYIFPIDFTNRYNNYIEDLKISSKEKNISLIFGGLVYKNNSDLRYNVLYVISRGDFNLYLAREPVRVFDDKAIRYLGNYKKISIDGINLGLALCFEENFPNIFRKHIVKGDSNLFIVVGNQYYIRDRNGLGLSSINANLRAAENNRYLFRLETSGFSKVVNNFGDTIYSIKPNSKGFLYYEVPVIKEKTFYSIYGNLMENFLFILSIIFLYLLYFRNKHNRS